MLSVVRSGKKPCGWVVVVVGNGEGATARGTAGPVSQGPSQSAGVPDGVRRGPGSIPARALRWMSAAAGLMGGGWSKSVIGTSARAWVMKSCHVLAGMVPPNTRPTPLMRNSGVFWLLA